LSDLSLNDEFDPESLVATPPEMSFRKMAHLALRTWPYMRPMLKHLILLLALGFWGGIVAFGTAFVGTDLITNKVVVGEKLQPIQAAVLFVGDEYVTTDPEKLGKASGAKKKMKVSSKTTEIKADTALNDIEPELTPAQRRTVRNRLIIWTIVGGVFLAIVGAAVAYYNAWVWQSINQNLRVAMVERAETLSLKYHEGSRVGDAIFRVYQDSAMIVNVVLSGIIYPALGVYGVLVGLAVVAAFDPWFAFIVLAVAVPVGWIFVKSTPRIRRRALASRMANSNLLSRLQESFAAIKVVKANGAEARVFDRFDKDSTGALNAAYSLRLDMTRLTVIVAVLTGAMLIGSEYIMASWVIESRDTFLGALVATVIGFVAWNYGAFLLARGQVEGLGFGAQGLLGMWMQMQDLFIALERAFYLLDLEPEVADPTEPLGYPEPIEQVAWRGVRFGYNDDREVLKGIDLEAAVGTVTAIVGGTGSGKSTLTSLLLRLYDPSDGRVEVNGIDLRDMTLDDIRAHCAIALQKNVLFADTVANNISFGAQNPSRAEIERAATIACADEFVRDMPKGYDTELGERGGKLSAGQRQRLSIARAVVRDTPILILDEPTASLDARTEQRVLANLSEWGADKVIFLITHRLSTIKSADQIALLEEGRIVEQGTHDELMGRTEGRYQAFVDAELAGPAGSAGEVS
jgi:ABC-type multidrug transport system fused ATPase/permease subunit